MPEARLCRSELTREAGSKKARTGNIWQAQSQTANRQSTEARQEETARQKVITMLAAGAAGLGSRSTGSARGTASSYLQGGGSTGGSAYAAALSARRAAHSGM